MESSVDNHTYKVVSNISLTGLLGLIFLTLKLCHVIDWPWLWVLAPFWIPLAICGMILLFLLTLRIISAIKHSIDRKKRKKRFHNTNY